MSAALEGGAFQYVRASSRRKHTKQNRQPDRLLQKCLRELKDGDWLRACKQLVRDSPRWTHNESNHVLCLGLGSPTYSLTAAAQLAFLLQLCDDMCLPYSRISAYDPAFSEDDNKLLDELKIHRVTENLEGKHAITSPTLVFMPHCDVQLYEALLAANWTHERLTNMLLVCNQFSQYQTSIPRRIFEAKYPHLLRYG
ncbi:SRR1-domain-containing protein [Heliocybe sulcata]|uniref:SRR1-domain-containing protein n=1 Tax=Heliocybe sulcata TaxID=5364 RepID=A0A5C3NMF1_9AGAM|nr:SRR1-domain-containing protein [Heliocybe sulcata]